MPAVKIPVSEPTRVGHWIETREWKKANEEIFLYFNTTWRGQEVEARFQANRYPSARGEWSEWRIWCEQLRPIDGGYGSDLSDTARHRVRDAFKPTIEEWLASEKYVASRVRAFQNHAVRIVKDLDYIGEEARAYEFLAKNRVEFTDEFAEKFDQACIAFREFVERVKNLESE